MANGSRQAAWEFFGAELKRRREEAGFTQVELGSRVFVSGGYIGQFEQAIRKPQLDVAQRIDDTLQTDGFFERLWRTAHQGTAVRRVLCTCSRTGAAGNEHL